MNNNDNKFKVINEQGVEIICDILFTFDNEDTGKSYIVYTDNTKDEFGNIQVFASIYDPTQTKPKLEPIETEQEWKVVETILNSLQGNIRNGMNKKDFDELIDAVRKDLQELDEILNDSDEEVEDEFIDIEDDLFDDFEILDEEIEEELVNNKHVVVKLHFYEKKNIFNHSPHLPHDKIGEAIITGECGTVTIGSSLVSDIRIDNTVDVDPIHIMLVIINGKVFISNFTSASSATLNHQEIKSALYKQPTFYELKHGDYFTIGHRFKVYMEIADPEVDDFADCPLCGNEYFKKSKEDQYCIDCRKQFEEEMALDVDQECKVINLNNYKDSNQYDNLGIVVIPVNIEKPKLFESIIKRM